MQNIETSYSYYCWNIQDRTEIWIFVLYEWKITQIDLIMKKQKFVFCEFDRFCKFDSNNVSKIYVFFAGIDK